jgi:hypothetical protein
VLIKAGENEGYKTYKTNIRGALCQFNEIDFLAVSSIREPDFYHKMVNLRGQSLLQKTATSP